MKKEESVCSPLSVALGNFDGVHRGHAALLSKTVEIAAEKRIASAVWTFSDAAGGSANKNGIKLITDIGEKLELISHEGIDYAFVEDFENVRNMSPESFVREILVERLNTVYAICGFNFRFGFKGAGDAELLAALMGGNAAIIPPVHDDGITISSSIIRTYIEAGDTEKAAKLLGHSFSIEFPVVHGKEIGRTIGIPTINQNFPENHIIPKTGIYACTVSVEDRLYAGVANVGYRPTVDSQHDRINCETHIIDFDGWLYDKRVKVSFCKRLRSEMKFDSLDRLREQISGDIESARAYFIENKGKV